MTVTIDDQQEVRCALCFRVTGPYRTDGQTDGRTDKTRNAAYRRAA